jgi:hypothetical protein
MSLPYRLFPSGAPPADTDKILISRADAGSPTGFSNYLLTWAELKATISGGSGSGANGAPGMDGVDGEDGISIPGAAGAAGAAGISAGFNYTFTSTVITNPTDDPGTGNVAFNDATFMSDVTRINIYGTSVDGAVNFSWLANEVGIGSLLMFTSLNDPNRYGQFVITSLSRQEGWVSLVVTYSTSGMDMFDNNEPLNLNIINKGASGSSTPDPNSVTRAMLSSTAVTGGKNWVFLGQATASGTTATGNISWAGQFSQLMLEYWISGYAANGIGRICIANSGTPSTTATTACTALIQGVTLTTTSVSCAGWPVAVTVNALPRYGWMFIDNANGGIKRMTGHGITGGTAPTAVPTMMQMGGMSSQTTLIQVIRMVSYNAITGNVLGGAFNAGTTIILWGRNDD